tara:strand:- start:670 stop:936 length:267 start_codon:yes stop_codon:yes gene_type:complete
LTCFRFTSLTVAHALSTARNLNSGLALCWLNSHQALRVFLALLVALFAAAMPFLVYGNFFILPDFILTFGIISSKNNGDTQGEMPPLK